MLTGVKHWF